MARLAAADPAHGVQSGTSYPADDDARDGGDGKAVVAQRMEAVEQGMEAEEQVRR